MTAAISFLRSWHGDLPAQLTAIIPDGPILPQRDRRSVEDMAKFVIANDGTRNLYYAVNAVHVAKIGKATKSDITHAIGCHCDIDYRAGEDHSAERVRILERLRAFSPRPTVIIFSGGGFNVLWKFRQPMPINGAEDIEAVEAANRWLEYELGGDHCHNIDRILRLPGSWNLPSRKKVQRGRVKARADIVEANWSRLYGLGDLGKAAPRGIVKLRDAVGNTVTPVVINPVMPASFADLGIADHVGLQEIILHGGGDRFRSRSEAVWHVVCDLVRRGVADDLIVGMLLHPQLAISASIREKGDRAAQYAARQVIRARLAAEASDLQIDETGYEEAHKNGPL